MITSSSPSSSEMQESRETRKRRRAFLKELYDWALDRHAQAMQPVEKTFKRNLWLSAFATIITPLSLFVTIPFLLNLHKKSYVVKPLTSVLIVLVGLVPLLSGILSLTAAFENRVLNLPKKPPVKKLRMKGKPEEVKNALKNQARAFEENYERDCKDKILPALREFSKGRPQEFEKRMEGVQYETVTDERTEMIEVFDTPYRAKTKKIDFSVVEQMPAEKFKPSKIFVAAPDAEDETDVYLEEEQDIRRKIRAGEMLSSHKVTVVNRAGLSISNAKLPPDFTSSAEENRVCVASVLFFNRSIVRSAINIAELEVEYKTSTLAGYDIRSKSDGSTHDLKR